MKKRVLALLTVMVMVLAFIPTAFAATDEAILEVTSLGIVRGDGNGNLRLEDDVTRGEFATIVTRLMGYDDIVIGRGTIFSDVPESHVHSGAIALMSEFGYINGDGKGHFFPDNPITVQDCLKILVCATGYEMDAKAKGGYPSGYIAVATKFDMTKGLERSIRQNATRGDVIQMVYHALYVDILEPSVTSGGNYSKSGETFKDRFAYHDDIHHISGIVTANYDTWLVAPSSDIEKDEIEVDGVRYVSGNINTRSFLGKKVELYYREEVSGKKTVLNMAASDKNNEYVVDGEDFVTIDGNVLKYYNENEKKQEYKLESDATYIYNNRVMVEYAADDLAIEQGRYVLVDNNNNDRAEYVFIYEYENSIVDRTNANGCIYLKTTLPVFGRTSIVLDEDKDDFTFKLLNAEGKEITIKDVEAGNVVTAYQSFDGQVLDIVISDKSVEGKIKEITEDNEVLVGDTLLGLTNSVNHDELFLGNNVIAYVNEFDKIVYLEAAEDSTYKFGYIMEIGTYSRKYEAKILVAGAVAESEEIEEGTETQDEEETVSILLCKNSEVLYANLASRVKFNGRKVDASDVVNNPSYPVKFKLNADDEISEIEVLDRDFGLDILIGTSSLTGLYFNSEDGTFYNSSSAYVVPFAVNADTKVICVPTNEVNASDINSDASDEELLSLVRISPQSKNILHVSGYVVDEETQCVELLVVKNIMEESMSAQENVRSSSDVALVMDTYVSLDEEDDELKVVKVLTKNGEADLKVAKSKLGAGDNAILKDGDLILYLLDNNGEIFTSKVIKSLGNGVTEGKTYPLSAEDTYTSLTGKVQNITRLEINAVNGKRYHELEVVANGVATISNFTILSKPAVFIYDKADGDMIVGEFDDIMIEDTVCVVANQGSTGNEVKAIVVVRGE